MSEVAARGRGRGRGGFRGASRGGGRINGKDRPDAAPAPSIEDEGEIGQLKKQYGSKVSTIKEMFPDWTDQDVVFALQETDGDLESTVERIADGTISQWGAVSKESKKDRSKSKVKEAIVSTFGESTNSGNTGGRTSFDGGRGRGRGGERGRGGRSRGTAQTNGSRKENAAPSPAPAATSTVAWDAPAPVEESQAGWGSAPVAAVAKATSTIIPDGVKKSWASIFALAPVPKKAQESVEKPAEPTKPAESVEDTIVEPEVPAPAPEPETIEEEPAPVEPTIVAEPEGPVPPSKDELTETNLEQVPDVSGPVPSATAASTAASSWDPRNVSTGTPYSGVQNSQPQAIRPPASSGFQASALKATGASGRSASYQRRVLDQEEAVRMPGNREVDRAAVQFGAFNLNGSGDDDVDGDREEPETRAQPPQHSPVAPRAALPPALQQPTSVPEAFPAPKATTGLPAATHPTGAPGLPSPQPLPGAQNGQPVPQGNGQFGQYGRYGQAGTESSLPPKPFDGFSQQAPSSQSAFEGFPSQQVQAQPQQPQPGAFSSAPNDYSSYYTADPQQRNAYNSYYQQQQYAAQGQQEGAAGRSYGGYGGPQGEVTAAQFPQSSAQQPLSRFATAGEGPASGHTTPNPTTQNQPQGAPGGQPQPGHPQQPQAGNYPYGHPYYSSPYYAQYLNYQQQYGAGGYAAGPYGAKGAAHGQAYPGYGMTPGAPYEHASSPAAGGFGGGSLLHGRDSALGGLGDYGRAGSTQSSQTPQGLGGGAFGGTHDAFGRGASYQGQTQQHYNGSQGQPGAGDDLKPFGDSKAPNGPSPSLSQAGRPGSATNPAPGVLPPPQSQQGGYGGYPAHLQQGQHGIHGSQAGSQYGGVGAAAGHQAAGQGHQNSQYGGYQQAFGAQGGYYGSGQQQRGGGWGGNYGH